VANVGFSEDQATTLNFGSWAECGRLLWATVPLKPMLSQHQRMRVAYQPPCENWASRVALRTLTASRSRIHWASARRCAGLRAFFGLPHRGCVDRAWGRPPGAWGVHSDRAALEL